GQDTMLFNGANVGENIDLSANGSRLRFTRDVANIVMDTNGVEQVNFTARGGSDTITVNDLTGTGVTGVTLDLAGVPGTGTGDGQSDAVIVNGTAGDDNITVKGSAGAVNVTGLAAAVKILATEPVNDTLTVNALAGADVINAS